MKIRIALAGVLLLSASLRAEDGASRTGTLLLLHYRWIRDSLILVESERVPAAIKPNRLSAAKRARRIAEAGEVPRSGFSFDLLGPDGKKLATRYLQEPGVKRVEFQEKGEHTLRSEERKVDSTDIFLRIPEPEARTIRFYRHARTESLASPKTGTAAAPVQGPEPLPTKSLLAEFPLD